MPLYKLQPPIGKLSGASPHIPSTSLVQDTCAACHQSHTGQTIALGNTPGVQASLCYRCHGAGDTFNVQADFTGKPANNAATASYYSHPIADVSAALHVLGEGGEFEDRANRHAVCADCHQPHNATGTRPQQSTSGWTASGDVAAASGVAVTNGAAATVPTYQLLELRGGSGALVYEYQLCFKCHSSFTELPVRSTSRPSWWALDKAVELNPATSAYHPVEAAGKNVSAQMAGSLAGTSPFKAWNFTIDSTIRCTHCHGDPATVNQTGSGTPLTPAADAYEASHASPNRGILIAPYKDRVLKPQGQAYNAADFALCFLCHTERPFTTTDENPTASDTAFYLHGRHIRDIGGSNPNTSIDTVGAGNGFAVCAECHFRIHGNALAWRSGDTAPVARDMNPPRLVNFAPNVTGAGGTGTGTWNQPTGAGTGSCTLRCHGVTHTTAMDYQVAPATGFTATPTTGSAGGGGLLVTFTDATRYITAGSATFAWTFGDGGVSALRNPTHTYTLPGTYSVTLTVTRTGAGGLSMPMTRTGYITVAP